MKIIIDANIIFSAILNTNSNIADLIINSNKIFQFISPNYLRKEIKTHYSKITKISNLTVDEIQEIEFLLYKNIEFISEESISIEVWVKSYEIVKNIDEKDTPYIAFAEHFNCKIWSGDKKLIAGLKKNNFKIFYTTTELIDLREKIRKI